MQIAKPYLPWGDLDRAADRALRAACLGRSVVDLLGEDISAERYMDWRARQTDSSDAASPD